MSGTGLGRAAFRCYLVLKVVIGCILFLLKVGGNSGRGQHKKVPFLPGIKLGIEPMTIQLGPKSKTNGTFMLEPFLP